MLVQVKAGLVVFSFLILSSLIVTAFWFQDLQYSLPTPKPLHLTQPSTGRVLPLPAPLELAASTGGMPLFLHFYNPDCPCSRFNLDHIRQLVRAHGKQIRFIAVIEGKDLSGQDALPMPTVSDRSGAIARACGVYSTPQAVLLDSSGKLYFRGNYNAGRYCTEHSSEYARLALDAMLASDHPAVQPASATVAYGCQLPSNPALPVGPDGTLIHFCRRHLLHSQGLYR